MAEAPRPMRPEDQRLALAQPRGEPRLPVLLALMVAVALPFLMPDQLVQGPRWLVPILLLAFVIPALVMDPGRIDRHTRSLHFVRVGFVVVFSIVILWATISLTYILVVGSAGITNSPGGLLRAGALVWTGLMISFAFVYWELDLGGPGLRANTERAFPDLAFPQDLNPEVRRPGWRPTFVDYLYLGLTNNLAFSPTDVMPLTAWAKLTMGVQSIASLCVLGLVIARAVNILR